MIDERIPYEGESKSRWMRRMDRLDALVEKESKWIKPKPMKTNSALWIYFITMSVLTTLLIIKEYS